MFLNITKQLQALPITHIIVCALACEAKPFIDFFKLKKETSVHAFSLYQSGSHSLIVSGIGQKNMAAAVNWLAGFLKNGDLQYWLNIGVSGHQTAEVGELFCTHTISNTDDKTSFYPTKWLKHKVKMEKLITVNREETVYKEPCLYDMEGFAFYQAATRFLSQEHVQCLKVVSDNLTSGINRDKAFISDLINKHCETIAEFMLKHSSALAQLDQTSPYNNLKQQLLNTVHFSHSQQLQLGKMLLSAQSHQLILEPLKLSTITQAKTLLMTLEQFIADKAVHI